MDSAFAGHLARLIGQRVIPLAISGDTQFALRIFGIKLHKPEGNYAPIKRLPKGWELQADLTAPGWAHIVDPLGQRRFEFCCLQDEHGKVHRAYTKVVTRYSIRNYALESGQPNQPFLLAYYIADNKTGECIADDGDRDTGRRPRLGDATEEDCEAYLNKHYPDWRKPLAYWVKPPRSWWRRLMSWPY